MSATANTSSRSSSPETSESLSDEQNHSETLDFSAWCHLSPEPEAEPHVALSKAEDKQDMPRFEEASLRILEEIFQHQSYESNSPESPTAIDPSVFNPPRIQDMNMLYNPAVFSSFSSDNSSSESAPVPDLIPRTVTTSAVHTKVIPPPPVQPRKLDNTAHYKVVYPEKESCQNLSIFTPNIPLNGTKSRVETQVRVALILAFASGSSGDPSSYDRVGSWKWLKLPPGTATRRRSRKEGKIDASPSDTLFLDIGVTCASNPTKQVFSCMTCQGREAKRVARKIAARVRPTRSDSDTNDGDNSSSSKIVQFNCSDTMDFSGGSIVLPLRITCYCRHHREKVGFNVHFTMRDSSGRVIGKGLSPPIMITDDHKSTDKSGLKQIQQIPSYLTENDSESKAAIPPVICEPELANNSGVSSRRRTQAIKEGSCGPKKRAKPYDSERTTARPQKKPHEENTENTELPGDVGMSSTFPSTTPFSSFNPFPPAVYPNTTPTSPEFQRRDSINTLPSPVNSTRSPISPVSGFVESPETMMQDVIRPLPYSFFPLSPPDTAPSSPPSNIAGPSTSVDVSSFAFNMFQNHPGPPVSSLPSPQIHRLIPSSGPTFGGIEVTVLGANFHQSMIINCVFGDTVASSTTRWSENTLVCMLPPRATSGVVPVTLEGIKMDSGTAPALFTYTNETDRSLMELALQVVGLKMTGKIEDAKDIAMRIVGNSAQDPQGGSGPTSTQMMNLASNALPESRRLLLGRGDDFEFEQVIMDSLISLDMRDDGGEPTCLTNIISHPTKTGQTLLHLAASLGFSSLVEFLIQRDINIDAQDINGYTALHFAVLHRSQCCARQIINAGADKSICNKMGYTALELALDDFFEPSQSTRCETPVEESDEESHFGDAEDDSGDKLPVRPQTRVHSKRRIRNNDRSRRSSVYSSLVPRSSDNEKPVNDRTSVDDDDNATVVSPECLPLPKSQIKNADQTMDEKQAASFAEYIQRAWAQFQPPPHLRPQMPHMPQLPNMPAWVYPVFIPMQVWPQFRNERHAESDISESGRDELTKEVKSSSASWEKWMAQMGAAMTGQGPVDKENVKHHSVSEVVPEVIPEALSPNALVVPSPSTSRSLLRRFRQKEEEVPEKEVMAYSYRPKTKTLVKTAKKEDRMLVVFWIPILILAIAWALYAFYPTLVMFKQYFN